MRRCKRRRLRRLRHFFTLQRKILRRLKRLKKILKKQPKREFAFTELLMFLKEKKFTKPVEINTNVYIQIPEAFSFSLCPEKTISILKELFYCGVNTQVKKIFIDHLYCKTIGLCASTVMDIILMELKENRKFIKNRLELSGRIPSNGSVHDLLCASGILKHLGFAEPVSDYIRKLELIYSGEQSIVATKVTKYFLDCLKTQNFTLADAGVQMLSEMIGEVIENCEVHGGKIKKWYTLGHYYMHKEKEYGECHITIFNFGQTIYESLKSSETTVDAIKSLNKITSRHLKFFKINKWDEESLWTLYALQDGVSRFRGKRIPGLKDIAPDRGTGTVRLIDIFQSIGKNKEGETPIMSITSGHTHILFDGRYKLKKEMFNGEERQVIAFNRNNDLHEPPDSNNVKILKNYFPGTVIAMKFYLDKKYLSDLVEEKKNGNRS